MLLEKYLDAAKAIVTEAVPSVSGVVAEQRIKGRSFASGTNAPARERGGNRQQFADALTLSYYEPAFATNVVEIHHDGRYQLAIDLTANERFVDNQFDYNKCQLVFRADGEELLRKEFVRESGKPFAFQFDRQWKAGAHALTLEVQPLTQTNQIRSLALRLNAVTVHGPFDQKFFVKPKNYDRYFPHEVPQTAAARRTYAAEVLRSFATRAFRRPVDDATVERLTALAEQIYGQPKQTFEAGVAQAIVGVLAAPRFLFREEIAASSAAENGHPLIDEFTLASRLLYFLWSTMPDEELMRLAAGQSLRKNLATQVQRMLKDARAEGLVQNFSGQWLQARDIETVQIDSRSVLRRDSGETGFEGGGGRRFGNFNRGQRVQLDGDLRKTMREETEMYFGYIVRENRSVLELLESRLHLSQRTTRQTLRADESQYHRFGNASCNVAAGLRTRRCAYARHRAGGYVKSQSDVAGETRCVHPGQHSRRSAIAPAPGYSAAGRGGEGIDQPAEPAANAGTASRATAVQFLPQSDGPARARPGKFQRHGHVANPGTEAADRREWKAHHG